MIKRFLKWMIKKLIGNSDLDDTVGVSDSVEVIFMKDGEIIERRFVKGHTWQDAGIDYIRLSIGESVSNDPVASMDAYDTASAHHYVSTTKTYPDESGSTQSVKWLGSWSEGVIGNKTISYFGLYSSGGDFYSSISASNMIIPTGISLDTYWTSTISSS